MKEIKLISTYIQYDDLSELEIKDKQLMDIAIASRKKAYAPYSNFSVGSAILLDNNEVITGNNQENAAYPSGMCAERVAIYSAGSRFPNAIIKKIVITASSSQKKVTQPVAPCGSCRQAISEYEVKQNHPIEIIFMGETGTIVKSNSIKDLLPLGFDKSFL